MFTKQMKKIYTLLLPMLSSIHQSGLVDAALQASGYHVVCLSVQDKEVVSVGLKYVNNDACYPAIISTGQLAEVLESGQYDLGNISVLMTQTGDGYRATNCIPLLRKALNDAGFSQVPVISVSIGNKGVESNPGFKFTLPMIKRLVVAFLYSDLFERVVYRARPHETEKGVADQLHQDWLKGAEANVRNGSLTQFSHFMKKIIRTFDEIPLQKIKKPKVGVVGEILVRYSPIANSDVVRLLEEEGVEVVVPDIAGFMNYSLYNQVWKYENMGMSKQSKRLAEFTTKIIELVEKPMDKALRKPVRFDGIHSICDMAADASKILSIGNHVGKGWFLVAEMIKFLKREVNNIVCMRPFGCLPNHIVGKGVVKELRRQYPQADIAAMDYGPGVSLVNQLDRIRLMMTIANKLLKEENAKR